MTLVQGRDTSADLRKSAAERFASADGKTSAADRFICGFGQHQEDFDCQTKHLSLQGGKEKEKKKFNNLDKNWFLKLMSFVKAI